MKKIEYYIFDKSKDRVRLLADIDMNGKITSLAINATDNIDHPTSFYISTRSNNVDNLLELIEELKLELKNNGLHTE